MIFKKEFHKICQAIWTIGFVETSLDDILAGKPLIINWIETPKDRWYADPFILAVTNNTIELLVEEWDYNKEKGKITKLVLDKKRNKIKESRVILQLDTHLSFPAIYKIDGRTYICPENSQSGVTNVYIYNPEKESASLYHCICNAPLTDPIITNIWETYYLFSTQKHNANGNVLDIFTWDNEQQLFKKEQSVLFEENIARMAGHFFTNKGCVYRPAQVCNKAYGQAVSIQKISKSNSTTWDFQEVRRLYSTHKQLNKGMHTFNYYKGTIVVDAWGWYAPRLRLLFVDDWGNMRNWIRWISSIVHYFKKTLLTHIR